MEKRKKINQCTLEELNERLSSLSKHDKTLNSLYAGHLLARIKFLQSQEKNK
jgi:hypothetical protein